MVRQGRDVETMPTYESFLGFSAGLGGAIPVATASVGLGVVSCVALLSFLDRWAKGTGVDRSACVLDRALSLSASRSPVDLARVGDVGGILGDDDGMDGDAVALVEYGESNATELIAAMGVLVLAESHG